MATGKDVKTGRDHLEEVNAQINQEFRDKLKEGKKGGCFIATAAYGSPLSSEVRALRRFRDETLLNSRLGSHFVDVYYVLSPPLASLISRSEFLRRTVRKLLLAPLLRVIITNHRSI
jgi:hypothetical protein